jgi:thiamine biosynthesis protein ThiS
MVAKQGCQPRMNIEIVVNGDRQTTPQGQTVLGLLRQLGLEPARVAVELDRRIVKQPKWGETEVRAGAQIEIVQFVGGG